MSTITNIFKNKNLNLGYNVFFIQNNSYIVCCPIYYLIKLKKYSIASVFLFLMQVIFVFRASPETKDILAVFQRR